MFSCLVGSCLLFLSQLHSGLRESDARALIDLPAQVWKSFSIIKEAWGHLKLYSFFWSIMEIESLSIHHMISSPAVLGDLLSPLPSFTGLSPIQRSFRGREVSPLGMPLPGDLKERDRQTETA